MNRDKHKNIRDISKENKVKEQNKLNSVDIVIGLLTGSFLILDITC